MTSNATCLSHRHYCYQARVGARKALHWSHWAQLACACMSMAPSDPGSQLSQRKHLLGSGSSLPWNHKRLAPLEIKMCIESSHVVRLMDPLVSMPVVVEPAFLLQTESQEQAGSRADPQRADPVTRSILSTQIGVPSAGSSVSRGELPVMSVHSWEAYTTCKMLIVSTDCPTALSSPPL